MPRYPLTLGLTTALIVAALPSGLSAQEGTPADDYAALIEETRGLVAYWRLDEASGDTAADRGGQGIEATYAPGVSLGEPGLIGEANAAAGLGGTDDAYVDAGDVLDFEAGAPFSLEAWIQPDEFANPYPRLVMKEATDDSGNRQGYLLYISRETGRLGFERWRDGEANVVTTIEPIPLGEVTHVVAVYDGQAMRLYIDGEGIAEVPAGLGLSDTPFPFRIGARADGSSPFTGVVDEVAVYETALDAETIQAHFQAGSEGRTDRATPRAERSSATPVAVPATDPTRTGGADERSGVPTEEAVAPDAADVTPVAIATSAPPAAVATTVPATTVPTPTATAEPTPTETAPEPDETGTALTIDVLNLRAGPSTDDEILLTIPAGEEVVLTGEESGGFTAVEYAGASGWVATEFLELDPAG
jgi:hypothetical protein